MPQCYEHLITILGHTPRDRDELLSGGGHQPDKSLSSGSPRTPPSLSDEPVLPRSGGQPSKRVHRKYSVNSPHSKKSSKTPSVDDCLEDLSHIIREARSQKARQGTYAEELAQVHQILLQDGYNETDVVFTQTLNLCNNRLRRRAFLNLETKEGQLNWVNVSWDFVCSTNSQ